MTLRTSLLRWIARLLLTSVAAAVRWDDVDVAERVDQERLAAALEWDAVALQAHVTDARLAAALDWDAIDVYDYVDEYSHLAGPTEKLHDLPDDPDRIYIWQVESKEAEQQVTREIVDEYRREFGREPEAAHFVIHDLERLREFDPEQLAAYLDQRRVGGAA